MHYKALAACGAARSVASVRALPSFKATPKPIVIDECSTNLDVF